MSDDIFRVYRTNRRGISHAVRAGLDRTICGIPCDGWQLDRTARAVAGIACWTCHDVPTERKPKGGYRTRDRAYDIVFDDNLEAWRDLVWAATGAIGGGRLPPRFRGVWLVYLTSEDAPAEPIWFRGQRAFMRFGDARDELRVDAWGAS
jgi:hypothetical protein